MEATGIELMPRKSTPLPEEEERKAPAPSYLRLDLETYDELEELAEASGVSRHSVTLLAIRRGLASIREERAQASGEVRFLVEEHVRAQAEAIYRARSKRKTQEPAEPPKRPRAKK